MRLLFAAMLLAMLLTICVADATPPPPPEVWVDCAGTESDYRVCSDCTLEGSPETRGSTTYFKVKLSSGIVVQWVCHSDCDPEER